MGFNPQPTYSFTAVTGAYAANPADVVLVTTGATAGLKVTLPTLTGCFSPVIVRKVDAGTGTVNVVTADGTTIDGVAGTTGISTAGTAHTGFTFAPNVTSGNWNVVSA